MTVYQQGDTIRVSGTFTDLDGTAADADLARLNVRSPAGTDTSYTYPGTVTRSGTGAYHYDLNYATAGDWLWWFEFEMNGSVVATSEVTLDRVLAVPF